MKCKTVYASVDDEGWEVTGTEPGIPYSAIAAAAHETMTEKLRSGDSRLTDPELVSYLLMLGFQLEEEGPDLNSLAFRFPANTTLVTMDPGYERNHYTGSVWNSVDEFKAKKEGYQIIPGDHPRESVHPEKYAACETLESVVVPKLAKMLDGSTTFNGSCQHIRSYFAHNSHYGVSDWKFEQSGDTLLPSDQRFKYWTTLVRSDAFECEESKSHWNLPYGDAKYEFGTESGCLEPKWAFDAGCFTRADGTLIESISELPFVDTGLLKTQIATALVPELQQPSGPADSTSRQVEWTLDGWMQKGGYTLTYGKTGIGKTSDVMRILHHCADETLVFYFALEDAAGVKARKGALDDTFGRKDTFFPINADAWDLCDEKSWIKIHHKAATLRSMYDPDGIRDVIVCIDNLQAGTISQELVTRGPDTVRGHVRSFQRKTGFGVWLIAHENKGGEIFGAGFLDQGLDALTRITRTKRQDGALLHRREKTRNSGTGVDMHHFTLVPCSGTIRSSVEGETTVDTVKAEADVSQFGDAEQFISQAMPVADSDCTITTEQLREILDLMAGTEPGDKTAAGRQRRSRLKKNLIDEGVILPVGNRFSVGL